MDKVQWLTFFVPGIVPGRGLTRLPARPQGSVAVVDYTGSICSWLLFRSRLRFDLKLFNEVDDTV